MPSINRHGHAQNGRRSGTYTSWQSMKTRCLRPTHNKFHHYGGRGIKICERWLRFDNFLEDMGERPAGMTLERKDSNGDYEPSNCYWATWTQQLRNTSRNRLISYNGQTRCASEWAALKGMSRNTLLTRLSRGWSLERTMSEPLRLNQYANGRRAKR